MVMTNLMNQEEYSLFNELAAFYAENQFRKGIGFKMKKLNSYALIVSKFLEVLHWVGAAASICLLVLPASLKDRIYSILVKGLAESNGEITIYGFELLLSDANGVLNLKAVTLYSISAVFILSLMAMVFRNVYLIFCTARGKTWFAKGDTPFQHDITRMVREIGIFYISVPVVGLIMSIISRLVLGVDAAQASVALESFITGILILCLSQVFAYGSQLQSDVDGLV
ncbi:hypothetical protein [Anaerolentibacter hominis]|uniref:hypothetical protein n=1 Tax=Anaerolentibacter hominis TaxID=3079009 RepID=UPI0031B8170F